MKNLVVTADNCLNPYYTGTYSTSFSIDDIDFIMGRLNPYYTGTYSTRVLYIHVGAACVQS